MDRWDDTLSEDWVSQPRPSPPASLANGNSSISDNLSSSGASQSRIPRPKQRTYSTSLSNGRGQGKSTSKSALGKDNGQHALSERTSSRLNARSPSSLKDKTNANDRHPSPNNTPRSSRAHSDSSLQSVIHNTVQHKSSSSSPRKDHERHGTPEWKRRVVNGELGYGEQRDLFSPMGLENLFHPGTAPSRPQHKKGHKLESAKDDGFPSSPPPYPSAMQSRIFESVSDVPPAVHGVLEALEEEEEGPSISAAAAENLIGRQEREEKRSSQRHASHTGASCEDVDVSAVHVHGKDLNGESSFESLQESVGVNRTVSGQEDSRNEKFSPVFVSKHNTVDGRIDYAALDLSYGHLKQELGRLGLQESLRPSTRSSDHDVQYGHSDSRGGSVSPERLSHDWTSHSLPDDLSTSTEFFASKGGFINMRRGGYSNDGSFLKRNLSPSSNPCFDNSDISEMHRLRSEPSASLLPTSPIPIPPRAIVRRASTSGSQLPALLPSPATSPNRGAPSPRKSESSGSPLKLFGQYDTFTNDRLLRRMGQFQPSSSSIVLEEESRDPGIGRGRSPFASVGPDGPVSTTGSPNQATTMSGFGEGKFHGYKFKEEISVAPSQSISQHVDGGSEPAVFDLDSGAESQVAIRLEKSPEIKDSHHARERRSHRSTTRTLHNHTRRWVAEVGPAQISSSAKQRVYEEPDAAQRPGDDAQITSKRPPNSPAKDPAPKRRRTYGSAEAGAISADLQSGEQRSQPMQSIVGRKRKDARYDLKNQEADPKVIALRQMLRPRTPTPTQHRKQAGAPEATEGIVSSLPDSRGQNNVDQDRTRSNAADEGIKAQTQALAAELANFALHAAENIGNDSRKPSITTQDFLNEATKVMNIIRAKGKPPSGLGSIEQSEAEEAEAAEDDEPPYEEQSTKDEFSRPPSREGGSLRILRAPKQLDPRVISHLRKFEEKDGVDDVIASSLRSLRINEHGIQNVLTVTRTDVSVSDVGTESDPSNIRILENAPWQRKRKHLSSSTLGNMIRREHDEIKSHVSDSSSGPSTGRSIPTGSSRSSGTKALIGPERVSHLIPDQAAGMTYDHIKQTWVRRKGSGGGSVAGSEQRASEGTEADPFEDIPDLSVDELEEIKRIETLQKETKEGAIKLMEPVQGSERGSEAEQVEGNAVNSRPRTRDGVEQIPTNISSVASKYSQMESSQPITDTRATSWGDEPFTTKLHPERQQETHMVEYPTPRHHEQEVEHEISILEGRVSKTPTRLDHHKHRARVVTVAFSSPLVNHVQSQEYEESPTRDSGLWANACDSIHEQSPLEHSSGLGTPYSNALKRKSAGFARRKSTHTSTTRKGQPFTARAISRIDEHTEVSFNQCHDLNQRQGLDLTISTPLAVSSPAGRRSNYSFHLSPLPDFTVHQLDESLQLDIDHVAKRGPHQSAKELESSFSIAVAELVKKITDVEPFEPYWEYIRQLHLRGQGLITLHLLRDFCARLEELDVSDNELGQLNGAPSTIRHLKIQRNCLSNLTAWAHLSNLQYLDVSGNQIESLEGFSSLIHLRELRADDNKIRDVEGIFELDGLITLRLRGNCVERVDFGSAELYVQERFKDQRLADNK